MKQQQKPPLQERIAALRDEIDAVITSRVSAIARDSPGVPLAVIRNLVSARAPECRCEQYLELRRIESAAPVRP